MSFSEASSLHSITGNWNDTVSSGDDAFSTTRFSMGYDMQQYRLEYHQRYDSYFQYANQTVQFLYETNNKLPLTSGDNYDLLIKPKRSASKGLRLGYKYPVTQQLNVKAFFSLLSVTNLVEGSLEGSASVINSSDYDFNFDSDLVYRDDPLYGRESFDLSGDGYALDLYLDYRVNDQWSLELELLDVAGELSIDNAPFTTATATSAVKNFDDDGYLIYDPVISGFEGKKDYTYRFEMQSHLSATYTLANLNRIAFEHHQFANADYQEIKYIHSHDDAKIIGHMIPAFNVLGLSYESSGFSLGILADNLDYKKIKFLELYGAIHWSF